MDFADPPLEDLLTVVKDDCWKHIRNLVSPTFSSGKLRRVCDIWKDNLACVPMDYQNTHAMHANIFSKHFTCSPMDYQSINESL